MIYFVKSLAFTTLLLSTVSGTKNARDKAYCKFRADLQQEFKELTEVPLYDEINRRVAYYTVANLLTVVDHFNLTQEAFDTFRQQYGFPMEILSGPKGSPKRLHSYGDLRDAVNEGYTSQQLRLVKQPLQAFVVENLMVAFEEQFQQRDNKEYNPTLKLSDIPAYTGVRGTYWDGELDVCLSEMWRAVMPALH